MKKILICAATKMEIAPVKKILSQHKSPRFVFTFFVYQVGIPLSLYYLQEHLFANKYDAIISVGIGGAYSKKISLCSVVVIKNDCFGDMGAYHQDKIESLFEMGWLNKNQKPFKKEQLENKFIKKFSAYPLAVCNGVTVQQMRGDKKYLRLLKNQCQAQIESMEGACVHFIALQKNIPFLQIRSVSNYVGETNKQKWKIKEAIQQLTFHTNELMRILIL